MKIRFLLFVLICFPFTVSLYAQHLNAFKENGKWGYMDNRNKVIIDPKYDNARDFDENFAVVSLNGKYGYIDKKGKEITPFIYEDAQDFGGSVAVVKLNGKYGIINSSGKTTVDFIYDQISGFYKDEKYSPAKYNGMWGSIDKKGKVILDFKYDNVGWESEGYFPVYKNETAGYVDSKGKVLIPFEYTDVYSFQDGLAMVYKDSVMGVINKKNEVIIPLKYYEVEPLYKSSFIAVYQNGYVGFYNIRGKQLTDLKYTSYGEEVKDFLFVMKDEKMGLIDSAGKEVLACEYDRVDWDGGGDGYIINKNEKYGLFSSILKKVVIEPIYRYIEISEYSEYYIVNGFDELNGVVNSIGELIVPAKYYEITVNKKKKLIYASTPEGEDIYSLDGKLVVK